LRDDDKTPWLDVLLGHVKTGDRRVDTWLFLVGLVVLFLASIASVVAVGLLIRWAGS
jgi:hypothetical protein